MKVFIVSEAGGEKINFELGRESDCEVSAASTRGKRIRALVLHLDNEKKRAVKAKNELRTLSLAYRKARMLKMTVQHMRHSCELKESPQQQRK